MKKRIVTRAPHETKKLGRTLARTLKPGDIVYLFGDLGSGKTVLAKGICGGLGVKEVVTSSSFVIVTEYRGRVAVSHIDLYRLQDKDTHDLPVDEYTPCDGITIIEWADRIKTGPGLMVRLKVTGKSSREITIEDHRD